MEYITRHPHGWIVRIHYPDRTVNAFFGLAKNGGRNGALNAAARFVKEALRRFPRRAYHFKTRAQKNSGTGILGVCLQRDRGHMYYAVNYKEGGRWKRKRFYPRPYGGLQGAKAAAIRFRRRFEASLT